MDEPITLSLNENSDPEPQWAFVTDALSDLMTKVLDRDDPNWRAKWQGLVRRSREFSLRSKPAWDDLLGRCDIDAVLAECDQEKLAEEVRSYFADRESGVDAPNPVSQLLIEGVRDPSLILVNFFHPVTEAFPLVSDKEMRDMVEDIKKNGQKELIDVHPGKPQMMDGINRLIACTLAGVKPKFKAWDENGSELSFAVSKNIKRRHLKSRQLATIAVLTGMLPLFAEEAKRRQEASRAKPGEAADKRAPEKIQGRGEAAKLLADLFGTNPHTIYDAKALKQERPDLFEKVHDGQISFAEANRLKLIEQQQKALEQNVPTIPPGVPYDVIVADPPWRYKNDHLPYPTMAIDEIKDLQIPVDGSEDKLPIREIAAKNAILWLWVTNAHLREAFDVIDAWGFEYTGTMMTWVKTGNDGKIESGGGTGSWLRGQTEHCLIAKRGKPEFISNSGKTSLLMGLPPDEPIVLKAPREGKPGKGQHSRKPAEFYRTVDYLCAGSKVELFARPRDEKDERAGWALHLVAKKTPAPSA